MNFPFFLVQRLKEKGLSLKRLSDLTGIALKHLENLNSGNTGDLPPAPYLRGYFQKIGDILEFDGERAWKEFQFENEIQTSGSEDSLPKNRFAKSAASKKTWVISVIMVIIAVIAIFRLPSILGRPQIDIAYPSQELSGVKTSQILMRGKIEGGDKLTINHEDVIIKEDGTWQKSVFLQPGLNTIEITAKKFLGQETSILRQIIYEPPPETTTPTSTSTD